MYSFQTLLTDEHLPVPSRLLTTPHLSTHAALQLPRPVSLDEYQHAQVSSPILHPPAYHTYFFRITPYHTSLARNKARRRGKCSKPPLFSCAWVYIVYEGGPYRYPPPSPSCGVVACISAIRGGGIFVRTIGPSSTSGLFSATYRQSEVSRARRLRSMALIPIGL